MSVRYAVAAVKTIPRDPAARLTTADRPCSRPGRPPMRILMVGAGGVGSAATVIAKRRDFFDLWVVADYDLAKAGRRSPRLGDPRFVAARVDASSTEAVAALAREHGATHVSTRSTPSSTCRSSTAPSRPARTTSTWRCPCRRSTPSSRTQLTGVKLGDLQFEKSPEWEAAGSPRLAGIGIEPGPGRRLRALRGRRALQRDRRGGGARRRQPRGVPATSSPRRSPSGRRSRSA